MDRGVLETLGQRANTPNAAETNEFIYIVEMLWHQCVPRVKTFRLSLSKTYQLQFFSLIFAQYLIFIDGVAAFRNS